MKRAAQRLMAPRQMILIVDEVVPANNGNPIVPANPCNRAGNPPDPSVYQAKGQTAQNNSVADLRSALRVAKSAAEKYCADIATTFTRFIHA
jgi:hypothetical protein